MICQGKTTPSTFWGCVYSGGFADDSIIDVCKAYNALFAKYDSSTEMYTWIDRNPEWEWGSMPQAAEDTSVSPEQIASNVLQATVIRVTPKDEVPFGVLESINEDTPFYLKTPFLIGAGAVILIGGYYAYKKFK